MILKLIISAGLILFSIYSAYKTKIAIGARDFDQRMNEFGKDNGFLYSIKLQIIAGIWIFITSISVFALFGILVNK